tara:strand:- start:10484 stop:11458 length:975 start_codon:yes stop_codon:yes gene_type:complete
MIGIGGYGTKLSKLVDNNIDLKLSSCFHPDRAKASAFSKSYACSSFNTIEESLERVEAIIIATPDFSHYKYINAAIERGLNIFVEKPMVQSLLEAKSLEKKLQNYKPVFMVGHNMRREKIFRYIKTEVENGDLGDLVSFQIFLSHGGALNWDQEYWRSSKSLCPEGPLRVNGVHASDILEYLFGPIESVTAKMSWQYTDHSAPDSGVAMIKIGPAVGSVYTSWVVPSMNKFMFQFTNAVIESDGFKKAIIRKGRDIKCHPTPDKRIEFEYHDSRKEQLSEFVAAIKNKKKPETGLKEGIRALMFVEACNRSENEGREILLEELI